MHLELLSYRLRAVAVAVVLTAAGCAGSSTPADEPPTEQPERSIDEPSPEELAERPCSNPGWEEPPPEPVSLEETEQ